jgi:uncharacterized protein YodC (DUF2158 family)
MSEFYKGDVVRLKSCTSPLMTVRSVNASACDDGAQAVYCDWFDGNQRVRSSMFFYYQLELVRRTK